MNECSVERCTLEKNQQAYQPETGGRIDIGISIGLIDMAMICIVMAEANVALQEKMNCNFCFQVHLTCLWKRHFLLSETVETENASSKMMSTGC